MKTHLHSSGKVIITVFRNIIYIYSEKCNLLCDFVFPSLISAKINVLSSHFASDQRVKFILISHGLVIRQDPASCFHL